MNAVHPVDADIRSLRLAYEEMYLIIKRRRPDIAEDLKDEFWNKREQYWNVTERDLDEIQDIESDTRPRRKKITPASILQHKVPVELILRFVSIAAVLAFVIKIRFFSS